MPVKAERSFVPTTRCSVAKNFLSGGFQKAASAFRAKGGHGRTCCSLDTVRLTHRHRPRVRQPRRRYGEPCTPAIITLSASNASRVPSASPFSKSSPACPMVLVTWAMQSTRTPAVRANV
jgi:hypothetical protein